MSEKPGNLGKEVKEYGTSTDGLSTTDTTVEEDTEMAENPVGFDDEADRTEETSVETTDEGERSSLEEI